MPEETARSIRIPVSSEVGKHEGHQIRTIVISRNQGVKALYCVTDKKVITYLFAKNKDWTMATARTWVEEHTKRFVESKEVVIDQVKEFIKLAITYSDGETKIYEPSTPASFTLKEEKTYQEISAEKEHAIRIRDIATLKEGSFRKSEIEDGVYTITGKGLSEEGKVEILEYRFSPELFTLDAVREWAKIHTVKWDGVEEASMEKKKKEEKAAPPNLRDATGEDMCGNCEFYDDGTCTKYDTQVGMEQICDSYSADADMTEEERKACAGRRKPKGKDGDEDERKKPKPEEKQYDVVQETLEIVKVDKEKRLVYGVFLVPEKADHDGDVISAEDIEKVAHGFMADYRTIDEMHKNIIEADIVESCIAWEDDMDFQGKKISKGTWFGVVKVYDEEVWKKVMDGEYKGFSVRISGVREPIEEGK